MSRIDIDRWGLDLAIITARRATCLRRSVGCVLLDRRGHVLATGYNGVASGRPHCNEVTLQKVEFRYDHLSDATHNFHPHACSGANSASGQDLDACQAIHAEQNALLQCRDVNQIHTCYVTASPCVTCMKLLMNTSCRRIVYQTLYSHTGALDLWASIGGELMKLE